MNYIRTDDIEHYIRADDVERFDIKHGALTENPLGGSTTRFIANLIVDDIEADPPKGRVRRQRVNGRIVIDITVPDGVEYQYQPPSCIVTGDPSVNDLTTDKWQHRELLDAKTEAELIQRTQDGAKANALRPGPWKPNPGWEDQRAFRQLLEAFHYRNIIKPVRNYIPGRLYYASKKQKPTAVQLYEDLTSVGCVELWQSALRFDGRGRFSTLARRRILGEVSNEANYLRQNGFTSGDTVGRYLRKDVGRRTQTRLDRWIFSNLGAPPEELLKFQEKNLKRPIYHSLEEAAEAIKRANNLQHPDIYSDSGDDDVEKDSYDTSKANRATEPLEEYRDVYQSQSPLYWSPQLGDSFTSGGRRFHHKARPWFVLVASKGKIPGHKEISAIVDFWIKEFCDPPRIKAKPNTKAVCPPCKVKPTGHVLHPIDAPYWMQPRDKQRELAGKPYDPDRREVAVIRFKGGKTKRQYRQMWAEPDRSHAEWRSEYCAHPYAASYAKYMQEQEGKKEKSNVRPNREQAVGSASANVIVLQSRRSRPQRFHVCQQCNPPSIGERFACEGTAG